MLGQGLVVEVQLGIDEGEQVVVAGLKQDVEEVGVRHDELIIINTKLASDLPWIGVKTSWSPGNICCGACVIATANVIS